MSKNFLKYSNLTYDEILSQINDKFNSDSRFANFRESAIAQMMAEIFAGATDLVTYMLERRAEESFFDTARLRSSVILLARGLGYVTQRPIPAEARIKVKLKGDWTGLGLNNQSTIQVPVQSVFSYNGLKFVLKRTLTLNYADYSTILTSQNAETNFILKDYQNNSIEVVQGEIKEKVIEGNTNPQVGSTFQLYRIDDSEFSNRYGDEDYDFPTTKVWVGNVKSDETEYDINRRSLIDWEVIDAANAGEVTKVCVVRTAITEGVEVLFGDGRFAQVGASTSGQGAGTSNDNVYIQYLATKGSEANQVGAKDKKIQFSGRVFDSNGNDVTDRIEFYFESNITGGADMESIDSIRVNAPNIYYSLDRLVSRRDYVSYLKSLTSPIDIKNARAWGEQEELNERGVDALLRMFNIVFFSVVGPLYQTDISPYYVKTKSTGLDTAVLDFNYDDDELNQRNYFNVYTKGSEDSSNLVQQLKNYQTTTFVWKLRGDQVDTSKDGVYFSTTYGDSMVLSVSYTTDVAANNKSLSGTTNVTVDVATLSGESVFSNAMDEMASRIQSELRNLVDNRGTNDVQNANFGQKVDDSVTVSFNSNTNKFTIAHSLDTPAYIYSIEGLSGQSDDAAADIGISSAAAFKVTTDRELSSKIINVVDDLDTRSQVTIRNIYISPIIQTIDLVGNVYIKDLYDRQSEMVKIEDAVYEWFNNNADFNEEIYISNVVEIIEQFPSVLYADVRFAPSYPTNPAGGNFYNFSAHSSIETAGFSNTQKNDLYDNINTRLNNYVASATFSDTSGASERNVSYTIDGNTKQVQSYSLEWSRGITDRTFLEEFAKGLYVNLKANSTYSSWADSDNFIKLISDIRKDYLRIIRYNLIDTQGNIADDVAVDSDGVPIKGGYSLGNEIVKINIDLTYQYKR